jgi:hypothetical protein
MMASASLRGLEVKELRNQCSELAEIRDSLREEVRRSDLYSFIVLLVKLYFICERFISASLPAVAQGQGGGAVSQK